MSNCGFGVNRNDGVRRLMNKPNFNIENYVRSVITGGDTEINRQTNFLTQWIDNSALELKKEIYKNCDLFIEAAKAVGQLDETMHSINLDLTEQKGLVNELQELRLISDNKNEVVNNDRKVDEISNEYGDLLEKIDGISHIMKADKKIIYAEDVQELEPNNMSILKTVKLILMSDLLIVAKKYIHASNNEMGYRLISSYELSNVGIVNVSDRDFSNTANVFKLVVFPDTKLFKTETAKNKSIWLQLIEEQQTMKTRIKSQNLSSSLNEETAQNFRSSRADSNPTIKTINPPNIVSDSRPSNTEDVVIPDWLMELPDDLDVTIAERDFGTAVELVEKGKAYLEKITNNPDNSSYLNMADRNNSIQNELLGKINFRATQLAEALSEELTAAASRTRGGMRSVRTAARLLTRLGRRGLAGELLLAHRRALLTQRTSQVAREGSQAVFVTKLSKAFHRSMFESVLEFRRVMGIDAFQSRLYCWCVDEEQRFAEQLRILLIESRAVPFITLCSVVWQIRNHAKTVAKEIGVALETIIMECSGLAECWERLATDHAQVLRDAIELRALDETWSEYKLGGIKDRDTLIREMKEAEIDISGFIGGTGASSTKNLFVSLTQSVCQFSRSLLLFTTGLSRLNNPSLAPVIHEVLGSVLMTNLNHFEKAIDSMKHCSDNAEGKEKRQFILDNLIFINDVVLTKVSQLVEIHGEIAAQSPFKHAADRYNKLIKESSFISL